MAEKSKKRKLFNIPKISDLDEVVEVERVFDKLRKEKKSTNTVTTVTTGNGEPRSSKQQTSTQDEQFSGGESPQKFAGIGINSEVKSSDVTNNICSKAKQIEDEEKNDISSKQSVPVVKTSKPNAVIVNQRQKGNPVLKFFQNIPWEFGDILPDYVMGATTCALFLSIRYHNFNPDYIHERLKKLGNRYDLRVLLVQVDIVTLILTLGKLLDFRKAKRHSPTNRVLFALVESVATSRVYKDPHKTLKELTKIAMLADLTLILAWSAEEAARYIEMYKIYENKPPDVLQGQENKDYMSKLTDCLTTVKSVNKTDVITLISTFQGRDANMKVAVQQSVDKVISATVDDVALCPGFGLLKAKRLHDAFYQPFVIGKQSKESSVT